MKEKKLLTSSRVYLVLPIVSIIIMIVVAAGLFTGYSLTDNRYYLIAVVIAFFVFLVLYFILCYRLLHVVHKMYFDEIYSITYNNLNLLNRNNVNFKEYNRVDIKEIKALNDLSNQIKDKFANGVLVARTPDYEGLNLEYTDRKRNVITFRSFKDSLTNIIFLSQSFRNVIIEVYFDLDTPLLDSDINRLIDLYSEHFKDYPNILFTIGENRRSILLYIPVIGSFSQIRERLEIVSQESTIIIKGIEGITTIPAKYAIVSYPYSTEEYLLSDLRYARRQGKPYNLYLPNRIQNNINEKIVTSNSMNLNYMSKILNKLADLDYSQESVEDGRNIIKDVLNELTNYLNVDEAGILYNNTIESKIETFVATENATLKTSNDTNQQLISSIYQVVDEDQSYYLASRNQANVELGRFLDLYGINSGYFYIIKGLNNNVVAIIYLFNYHRDFIIDSYIREMIFVISLRIENYFEQKEMIDYIDLKDRENEYLMNMSKYDVYKIDEDFNIIYLTQKLKEKFPDMKLGMKCHKAYFNLDHPCRDCPLKTFRKKAFTYGKEKYEASLSLNDRKSHSRTLLVEKVDESRLSPSDLFDNDFLAYSYVSLNDALYSAFASRGRGFILLLTIDNYDDFLSSQGSEGYLFSTRCLIRKIKDKLKTEDVFVYNPKTIAIHIPYLGHADVINICEQIYPISKEHFLDDGSNDQFKLTYLPIGYPRGFANVDDLMKHVSDVYRSDKYPRNLDFIYFSDYAISRSASKRDFMVSVLESEFSSHKTSSVNLQPIVNVKDGHIFGAEILLRIADAHRNVFFNAEEISRIALQENKTNLITESIINYVGEMYKEYGKNVFKINDFQRMAINIDETYLRDPSLIKEVTKLCNTYDLPNNFLSFEIPEEMIPNYTDKFVNFARELSKYNILFSVDRYTGKYVGIEKLKELGFNEIKIARDIILKCDKDSTRLKELSDIVNTAKRVGLSVAAVGVENEAQYKILKDLDENMMVQGYYLYKPLTRSDLIAALISYN